MRRGAMRSWVVVLLLVAVGGVALAMAVRERMPKGDDVAQIRAMLDASEQAVERRNVSGMMSHVSEEYRDANGLRRDQIRLYVAQTLRDADNVNVTISEPTLRIQVAPDGKEAHIECDAAISLTDRDGTAFPGRHFHLSLDLKKEPARVFGVFPTHAWRVVSADGYGSLEGLAQ